jgi:hypothetical protein
MSQTRTVVSPEPVASSRPSGEKLAAITESVWPIIEQEERVIGRTRKLATGWYTITMADSEGCSPIEVRKFCSSVFISLVP